MNRLEDRWRARFGSRDKSRSGSMEGSGETTRQQSPEGKQRNDTSAPVSEDADTFEILEPRKHSPKGTDGQTSVEVTEKKTDLEVFENQLTTLQEQLVAVMIENQELNSQLRGYQDSESIQKLQIEIAIERKRYRDLEEKFSALETKSARDRHIHRLRAGSGCESSSSSKLKLEVGEDATVIADKEEMENKRKHHYWPTFLDRFWNRCLTFVYETMDDFSHVPELDKEDSSDGDPLTVKTLKENINRFGKVVKPFISTFKGVKSLLTWESPAYTLLVFSIYMYSVWMGWLFPLILLCLVFRLFVSYLQHHGFNISFNFFDSGEEGQKPEESLGISDKFNLVLQVARKAQNGLGSAADSLEKIKSLLTWRHPATRQLFTSLLFSFIMTCFLPSTYVLTMAGLGMGVKIFIINYFYDKYPRLKYKYDSAYKVWLSLPTDAQYERDCMKSEIDKYVLIDSKEELDSMESAQRVSNQDRQFCDLFSLPPTESPLLGWQGGRRCTLINKDKALSAGLKNGKIYLTPSFICFERKNSPSPKNIVIPLADIVRLQKCKPYSFLPGNGMALEIVVAGNKNFIFGGILNRDEAYDHIMETGLEKMLPWATGEPTHIDKEESPPLNLRKRNNAQKFKNFSLAAEYEDSD